MIYGNRVDVINVLVAVNLDLEARDWQTAVEALVAPHYQPIGVARVRRFEILVTWDFFRLSSRTNREKKNEFFFFLEYFLNIFFNNLEIFY